MLVVRLDLRSACPGLRVYPGFARTFAAFARALRLPAGTLVEITLASDAVMARLHRRLFGVGGSTDCIAIPTGFPGLKGGPALLGAFYMGVEEVRRNAVAQGTGLGYESAFVLAHGLLHLLGWEDGTEPARRRMFRRQAELVGGLARGGRLPRLLGFARRAP